MAFVTLWHTRYKLRRRNHGWPWLHTVRHSMLQQVATNKQYATRMLIIPVEKSLINSRPAIHLFNDSFPFTSGLIYWTACSGLNRRTAQTVSLKWRDVIWADRYPSRLSGDCWDGQIKRDNARWKQTNISSSYILSRVLYSPVLPMSCPSVLCSQVLNTFAPKILGCSVLRGPWNIWFYTVRRTREHETLQTYEPVRAHMVHWGT